MIRYLELRFNLYDNEIIREHIKTVDCNGRRKNNIAYAYRDWCRWKGFDYNHTYIKEAYPKLPYIPTERESDQLIAGFGPKYSAFLQLLKETGFRSIEARRLTTFDFDFERRIVTLNKPAKNSKPRQFKLSNQLVSTRARNVEKIILHLIQEIKLENTLSLHPQFSPDRPIIYTGDMRTWYTSRHCEPVAKSHINYCVYDSRWEATESFELERNPNIESWVKNDHIGFYIYYIHAGAIHKYVPDFIIRLTNGTHLILETKGRPNQQNRSKHIALREWVEAVNQDGRFGKWMWAVSTHPKDTEGIINKTRDGTLHSVP